MISWKFVKKTLFVDRMVNYDVKCWRRNIVLVSHYNVLFWSQRLCIHYTVSTTTSIKSSMAYKRPPDDTYTFKPPPSKQKKEEICILCDTECDETPKELDKEKWDEFREQAKKWQGLHMFGKVYQNIDWTSGCNGKLWHKTCKMTFWINIFFSLKNLMIYN